MTKDIYDHTTVLQYMLDHLEDLNAWTFPIGSWLSLQHNNEIDFDDDRASLCHHTDLLWHYSLDWWHTGIN